MVSSELRNQAQQFLAGEGFKFFEAAWVKSLTDEELCDPATVKAALPTGGKFRPFSAANHRRICAFNQISD